MEGKKDEKLAQERVENAKKRVARALSLLETSAQELEWACESMGWDSMTAFTIREASEKLGYALASLVEWNDEPEE